MTKEVGLWIDHKRAMIVILSEAGENVQQIASNAARHSRYHGATHPKSPYSAQYQKGDDQLDRQLSEKLNKYYNSISELVRGADALLIFGPGPFPRLEVAGAVVATIGVGALIEVTFLRWLSKPSVAKPISSPSPSSHFAVSSFAAPSIALASSQ